jgi:hypothetical protein
MGEAAVAVARHAGLRFKAGWGGDAVRAREGVMRYEFILEERLTPTMREAFPELQESAAIEMPGSVLFGAVLDGPHLHGLLDRFQTFGLTLVEMRRLPD